MPIRENLLLCGRHLHFLITLRVECAASRAGHNYYMNNAAAQYGDRRIVIARPGRETEFRVANATFAPDLLNAVAAEGLPPFTYLAVEVRRSYDWHVVSSAQTRPQPGWAAEGSTYCAKCGAVAFNGSPLGCGH